MFAHGNFARKRPGLHYVVNHASIAVPRRVAKVGHVRRDNNLLSLAVTRPHLCVEAYLVRPAVDGGALHDRRVAGGVVREMTEHLHVVGRINHVPSVDARVDDRTLDV